VLFESPRLICHHAESSAVSSCWSSNRMKLQPVYHDVERFPTRLYLQIGLFPVPVADPGTSRSGSTIVGALLLGVDKRAAGNFFLLAIRPWWARLPSPACRRQQQRADDGRAGARRPGDQRQALEQADLQV